MYKVFFEQYPLHDHRSDELQLRDSDVHLAVGESGSMAFTIGSNHPHVDKIKRFNGVLKLTAGDVTIFRGRVRKDTQDFFLDRRIEAEGLLACLNDSVIPPFNFPEDFLEDAAYQMAAESGNVVQFFLEWVLAQHNSQVTGNAQKIQLGTVTVADPNNYITRSSSDYLNTMEVVKKKLEELLGGYLVADYTGDTTVLHYYADLPLTNVQEVEFGKNLLDLETELDATDTYTAILPVGKDGLTISELADGQVAPGVIKRGVIVYSESAEAAAGGRIVKKVDWPDVTEATNLRRKAADMLTMEGVKHVQTITAKAVDLGGADLLPHFVVGRYVKLKSPPHGYAEVYPLMELDPNIHDPGDTQITLGSTIRTLTELNNSNQSSAAEQMDLLLNKLNGTTKEMTQKIEGIDGLNFWIKYSAHADGHDMTNVPTADTQYMGTYSARLKDAVAPTDYTLYTWVKITGKDGTPGAPGTNGKTQYLHIKYSDDGRTFTGNLVSANVSEWMSGMAPAGGDLGTRPSVSSTMTADVTYETAIPVQPADQYVVNSGNSDIGMFLRFYDDAGKYVSSSYVLKGGDKTYTVPAGVFYMKVVLCSSSIYTNFEETVDAFNSGEVMPVVQDPNVVPGEPLGAYIGTLVDFEPQDSDVFTDYTWKKFTEDVDDELAALQKTVTEQYTKIINDTQSIIMGALESYVMTGDYETYKKTVESSMTLLKNEFSLKFTETTTSIANVNGDLQETRTVLSKHFDFTLENGMEIKAGPNTLSLRLDNDLISFQKNGQQFGWWDGVDFHTGNIIIGVTERAQFGNFAFVPRSNGSLDFLKVSG